jgi:sugar phosphate isomerase/epimerase
MNRLRLGGEHTVPDQLQVGVQTWCFRKFRNGLEIAPIKECGFSSVELAGVHACVADGSWDEVISRYTSAGLKILGMGVQGLTRDREPLEKALRFLQRAGAKFMSVDVRDEVEACVPLAEELAQQYGVKMALHNHGRGHYWGSSRMIEQLFRKTGPQMGLCLDTAWALDAGEDPIAMVERFGERLYGLHIKDFVFDRAGKPKDVVSGTGNLDLGRLWAALEKVDFRGYVVLEYEGDVDDPVPAVKQCVKSIREGFKTQPEVNK